MTTLPKDPMLLLSTINMKLRDAYQNLDALCEDLQIEKQELVDTLAGIDYFYEEAVNQFR